MTAFTPSAGPSPEASREPVPVPAAVAAVLGADEPAGRRFTKLTHSQLTQASGGVWRVSGPAGSVVLKVCGADAPASQGAPGTAGQSPGDADPRAWNHGRREPLAYRDGLTATAFGSAGIVGPKLLAGEERADGSFALWLEDVSGVPGPSWTVDRLGAFAQSLGAAQAQWVDRVPDRPWLSRGWLRQYVASKDLPARISWDHPTAVAVWPASLRAGLRRMWDRRELLLSAAESGPRTLCHLDVWPLNLLATGEPAGARPGAEGGTQTGATPGPAGAGPHTVLLDWAFVGEGGVGEDIANLIPDCVTDGLMPASLLPEIAEAVLAGYLEGLREGGHRCDEGALRRAVAAAGAAKYCWLTPVMLTRLAAGQPAGSPTYDVGGADVSVLRRYQGLLEHLVRWSEQTLS